MLRVDERRLRRDFHDFLQRADFEREIDARDVVDRQRDAGPRRRLEAAQRGFDAIGAELAAAATCSGRRGR